jgi:glycyl-tRNA synthetase
MAEKEKSVYDRMTEVCLKRGFFYPDSEIHGAIAGFYDYGSVGTKIKQKWEAEWRRYFLRGLREPFFEIDTVNVMPEKVWEASGHLKEFVDPVTECKKCGNTERADHILESHLKETFEGLTPKELDALIRKHKIKCHACGGELKEVGVSNLMFGFTAGAYGGAQVYLRPETTQGVMVAFKREYAANREKMPLGLAIVGRAYRNEIAPRQGLFRMREFNQAEIQIFIDPEKIGSHHRFEEVRRYELNVVMAKERKEGVQKKTCADLLKEGYPEFYLYYMARIQQFYEGLGVPLEKWRFYEKNDEERAFYNRYQFDGEMYFQSLGDFKEILGYHYRTDHDLKGHEKVSGQDMSVLKEGKRFVPHVVELSFGVDRNVFAFLDLGFKEDEKRTYFSFPRQLSPYAAGIYPLVSKDGVDKKAEEVFASLTEKFDVFYDEGGSIGRRYARADEIGVKYGITIDYDTLKDGAVTVRDRDTTQQVRMKITDLPAYLA